jgi:hypothetical protein
VFPTWYGRRIPFVGARTRRRLLLLLLLLLQLLLVVMIAFLPKFVDRIVKVRNLQRRVGSKSDTKSKLVTKDDWMP